MAEEVHVEATDGEISGGWRGRGGAGGGGRWRGDGGGGVRARFLNEGPVIQDRSAGVDTVACTEEGSEHCEGTGVADRVQLLAVQRPAHLCDVVYVSTHHSTDKRILKLSLQDEHRHVQRGRGGCAIIEPSFDERFVPEETQAARIVASFPQSYRSYEVHALRTGQSGEIINCYTVEFPNAKRDHGRVTLHHALSFHHTSVEDHCHRQRGCWRGGGGGGGRVLCHRFPVQLRIRDYLSTGQTQSTCVTAVVSERV